MVTPRNCTKMLRNLTFVVQFAYFSIRPPKFCYFEQLLGNFLRYYGKMFLENLALMQNFGGQTRCIMGDMQMANRGKNLTFRTYFYFFVRDYYL